jgi:serine/threonine protein kinase
MPRKIQVTKKKKFKITAPSKKKNVEIMAPTMMLHSGSSLADNLRKIKKKYFHRKEKNEYGVRTGETISADFEGKVVGLLGHGGFGKVYKVESKSQISKDDYYKSYSAVKVINRDLDKRSAAQAVEDLIKEAAVTSKFGGYTYVVNARLLKKNGKVIGAIYDFIDGPDLSQFLHRHLEKGLLPPVEIALSIGERILRVLEISQNEYHLAHKDITLANCMLHAKSGTPRVVDWGGAHPSTDKTPLGKAPYMAPEIIKWFLFYGGETSPLLKGLVTADDLNGTPPLSFETYCKADIFSFGLLMYELIAGRVPFGSSPYIETAEMIKLRYKYYKSEDDIPRLHEVCDDVYKELSDIIHECLSYDPEKRPTPSELLAKFNYLLFGNGQMGFGTTDLTHAKYWQAFESGEDYTYNPELEKLLKAKLRKRCSLQFGANARIEKHFNVKDEVASMYRTFEEAFGEEYCHSALKENLIIGYEKGRQKELNEYPEDSEEINEKYNNCVEYVEEASYEDLNELFKLDSEVFYLEELFDKDYGDSETEYSEKEEILEKYKTRADFHAGLDKYNAVRKYGVLMDSM